MLDSDCFNQNKFVCAMSCQQNQCCLVADGFVSIADYYFRAILFSIGSCQNSDSLRCVLSMFDWNVCEFSGDCGHQCPSWE